MRNSHDEFNNAIDLLREYGVRPTENLHINDIRVGDVIICSDGKERTVCKKDINDCAFMGRSVFGDTYKLGHELIKRVVYKRVLPIQLTKE